MRFVVLGTALAGLTLACSEGEGLSDSGTPLPPTPFVVSNPVPGPAVSASGARLSASTSATAGTSLAYVSLAPGKIPGASLATIVNPRINSGATVPVVSGGFDPVGVTAAAGDTLDVLVHSGPALSATYRILVNLNVSPTVVRTNPPNNKRDVSLNPAITVVFSEPMDSASVIGALSLTDGLNPVPGAVVIPPNGGDILQVTLIPAAPLAPLTTYVLQVGTTAQDWDGQGLTAPVTAEFTTDSLAPDVTAPLVRIVPPVGIDSEAVDYPAFRAVIDDDRKIVDVTWELDDGSGNPTYGWNSGSNDWSDHLDNWYVLADHSDNNLSLHPGIYNVRLTAMDFAGNIGSSAPFTMTFVAPDSQPRLVVRSFSVVEFYDPNWAGWIYTPQLVVADAPGQSGLRIVGFEMLTIPGLTRPSWSTPWKLTAFLLSVPPGQDTPLFPKDWYGEPEPAFGTGGRSSGGEATARLTYRDEIGHFYTMTVKGDVVPGDWPTTFTGACAYHWSWEGMEPGDLSGCGWSEDSR
jgi:hypothetical protein